MLFAANHVLHRLLPPRHPPSALSSLTINRADRPSSCRSRPPFRAMGCGRQRADSSCIQDALSSERYSVIKDRRIRRSPSRLSGAGALSKSAIIIRIESQDIFSRSLARIERTLEQADVIEAFSRRVGGAGRDRTDDLRLAKPALSQLSYSPRTQRASSGPPHGDADLEEAGGPGWTRTTDLPLIRRTL